MINSENQYFTPTQSVQQDSNFIPSEPTITPPESVQVPSDPERSPVPAFKSEGKDELPPPGFVPGRLLEHVPHYARIRRYAEDVNYLNKIGQAEKPPVDDVPQVESSDLPNPASLPRPSSSGTPTDSNSDSLRAPIPIFNVNLLNRSNTSKAASATTTDIPSTRAPIPFMNSAPTSNNCNSTLSTQPQTPACSHISTTNDSTSNSSLNPPSQRRRRFVRMPGDPPLPRPNN